MVVYEVVDVSDDEHYYPLGVFLSLSDAVSAIEECERAGEPPHSDEAEDYRAVEIRGRPIGWSDYPKAVWRRAWTSCSDEDAEPSWERYGETA